MIVGTIGMMIKIWNKSSEKSGYTLWRPLFDTYFAFPSLQPASPSPHTQTHSEK